jgi:hypothetical protein
MKNLEEIRKYYGKRNANLFHDFTDGPECSNMLNYKLISYFVILNVF